VSGRRRADTGERLTPKGALAIETIGLRKCFGSVTALDDLSITVEPGEVYGFLGPNGAGKTTTIRLPLGLARATSGEARLFGLDAWAEGIEAHRRLAFVPGEFPTWPTLRVGEILDLSGSIHGGHAPSTRDELYERFEFDPSRKGRKYSKGNRQKICLIAAFMIHPGLLVLDEPTNGLDPLMEITFRHCVNEAKGRGQTVFLSSHILSEVEVVCHRVGILRAGRLIEVATLDELRRAPGYRVGADVKGGRHPVVSKTGGKDRDRHARGEHLGGPHVARVMRLWPHSPLS